MPVLWKPHLFLHVDTLVLQSVIESVVLSGLIQHGGNWIKERRCWRLSVYYIYLSWYDLVHTAQWTSSDTGLALLEREPRLSYAEGGLSLGSYEPIKPFVVIKQTKPSNSDSIMVLLLTLPSRLLSFEVFLCRNQDAVSVLQPAPKTRNKLRKAMMAALVP